MLQMLYVLGLAFAFASLWFVVAAFQSFEPAQPVRPFNIVAAIATAALAAGLFWLGRSLAKAEAQERRQLQTEQSNG
jgi:hypothetical protein